MSFFGVTKDVADNTPSRVETTNSAKSQPKIEEKPIIKVMEKAIEAEYPVLLKADAVLLPSYYEVSREDKGVLEDFFFDYLVRQFPDFANNSVAIKAEGYNLTPDLAIINVDKNIFIAIEIDEPYSVGSGGTLIPIHTIGSDIKRDDCFVKSGWTVIRFAEEQVARYPQLCVDAIYNFINVGRLPDFNKVKCWTTVEAQTMIADSYRNTYLPFAFQNVKIGFVKSQASYRSFELSSISKRSKNGKKYVQIHLKYPRTTTDSGEIIAVGNHPEQCWVEEEVFWSKVYASKFGELINDYNLEDTAGLTISLCSSHGPVMVECYGKQNGVFFNIIDEKVDIIFSSVFLESVKNWYLEIINKVRAKHRLPKLT